MLQATTPNATASRAQLAADAADAGPDSLRLSVEENANFMRIVCSTRSIRRHFELYQLMRGNVQFFLPHQVVISAWGSFGTPALKLDVVSALPRVRTGTLERCDVKDRLSALYERWRAGGRRLVLLDADAASWLGTCRCALHRQMRSMSSYLLHGVHSARDGTDVVYLAAHDRPYPDARDAERFCRVMDLVLPQIDAAFRRVAGYEIPGALPAAGFVGGEVKLSLREEEILSLVAHGRTNFDIATALGISVYTVKNHLQRIMRKLGTSNRTEAAAIYRGPTGLTLATHEGSAARLVKRPDRAYDVFDEV